MANFEVPEKPEFNNQIRKLEASDPAHADLFNAIIEALLNNELFLKNVQDALVESLKGHLKNETNPHKVTKEQVGVPENAVFTDTTYEVFKAPNTSGIGAKAGLVPAPTVADIPKVLGGGGTWVAANGHSHDDYASSSHTHSKSQITDFPSSLPASDVYAWAKAASKPSYAWSEITGKPVSFTPSDHLHSKSQITDFPSSLPASDVYAWAKAASKPSYAWSEITDKPSAYTPSSHAHDYLPASGYGTTSSGVQMYNLLGGSGGIQLLSTSGSAITIGSGSNEVSVTGNHATLTSNGHIYCNGSSGSSFMCQTSNYMNLGHSSYKWKAVYATTGTIQTSDRNAKNNIEDLNEDFVSKFMLGLKPVRYKLNESDSDRYHWGLISQDIEETMIELGMDSKDFAGFIKSPKTKLNDDGTEETVEGKYTYSLRYDEFIAPMIKLMQHQQNQIEELKKDTESLKEELLKLRA